MITDMLHFAQLSDEQLENGVGNAVYNDFKYIK